MVKRRTRKHKTRKAVRKTSKKRPARRKRKTTVKAESPRKAILNNRHAHWSVYRELQKKANKAWDKLRSDVKRKAPPHVLLEDRNHLLLLLGECNYLAGECMRMHRHHH